MLFHKYEYTNMQIQIDIRHIHMGGRRESDTALLHGLSQCDSQCGSLDASIARQRRTIAQLHNCLQYAQGGGRNDPSRDANAVLYCM